MDITLNDATPTADATALTEGNAYSIVHRGGITVSVDVVGTHLVIYTAGASGGCYLPRLPGTVIRLARTGGAGTSSFITIV